MATSCALYPDVDVEGGWRGVGDDIIYIYILQQCFANERGVDSAQLSEELTDGRSRSHDSEDRSVDG